jgi:hypothetical protein
LRWPEIDQAASKLLLPKERTKSKRPHELTLSPTGHFDRCIGSAA